MTQAEWLNTSQDMASAIQELMRLARTMDLSSPITIAINKDGMSWAETHDCGHLYEINVMPGGSFNLRCDRNEYFSSEDMTADSGAGNDGQSKLSSCLL